MLFFFSFELQYFVSKFTEICGIFALLFKMIDDNLKEHDEHIELINQTDSFLDFESVFCDNEHKRDRKYTKNTGKEIHNTIGEVTFDGYKEKSVQNEVVLKMLSNVVFNSNAEIFNRFSLEIDLYF